VSANRLDFSSHDNTPLNLVNKSNYSLAKPSLFFRPGLADLSLREPVQQIACQRKKCAPNGPFSPRPPFRRLNAIFREKVNGFRVLQGWPD